MREIHWIVLNAFSFLNIFLFSVWGMHVLWMWCVVCCSHVDNASAYCCGHRKEARGGSKCFLCHSPPYSFKSGSLVLWSRLTDQQAPRIYQYVQPCSSFYMGAEKFDLWSSCVQSKCSYPVSHLPSIPLIFYYPLICQDLGTYLIAILLYKNFTVCPFLLSLV